MHPFKRSIRAFGLLIGSYMLLTFLSVLPSDSIIMLDKTSSVFYFLPAVIVFLYFSTRIIDRRVRKYLSCVGGMIIFWVVLRAAKYVAFEETEYIARSIWYLYYIPTLAIPQFSFQAALSVGEPEDKKLPPIQIITGIMTTIFVLLVLTNDLHQFVFRFHPNFTDWNTDYIHEPLFWIIMVWDYLFFFFSTAVLFHKSRLSASRRLTWIPVVYLGVWVLALYLLNTGNLPRVWGNTIGEFPDMSCYMLGGVWILCITIGLVPSNIDYGGLMQETGLGTRIADMDYRVVYQSRSAFPLTKEQLASASPVSIDGDTLVYRRTITGGHVYWQTDISELNRINCELEEARERTTEESELLRRTNELKEQRAQISAKSRVYDDIAVRVHAQSQKIAALSAEAQQKPEKFEMNMRQISIYAAYIKRVSNMMLLSSDGRLPKKELTLAIAESARYLSLAGVFTEISGDFDDATVDEGMLISIYEQFEMLLEQAMPALYALQITLSADTVKLVMEGASLIIPENVTGTVELDDDTAFVQLRMSEGGVGL